MTHSLLLLALLGTGCVVLPATKTTTRSAGTEQAAFTHGAIRATTLQTSSTPSSVRVRAMNARACHRQIVAVTEITTSKHATLGVDDPRARAVGVILAPVTIPISALITGIVVANAEDKTRRVTKPIRTETIECTTEAAGLALDLRFTTGHIYRGKTDANGVLIAAIPSDEPYAGTVHVTGAQASTSLQYRQPLPPVTAARDAIETCRAEHPVPSVTLKLTIDAHGKVTAVWQSAGDDRLASCVRAKLAGAIFPSTLRNRTVVLPFEAPTT